MNSHFQSRETTSTSTGGADVDDDAEVIGARGSRSCEPTHAMPPRNRITRIGIAHTVTSIGPEYSHSGSRRPHLLPARNHHANASVSRITGTITASMITVALSRIVRSAAAIGPCGSSTPCCQAAVVSKADPRLHQSDKVWRPHRHF